MMTLEKWCEENLLLYEEIEEKIFVFNEEVFLLKEPYKNKLFKGDFTFKFSVIEKELLSTYEVKYILFQFGGRFYYSPFDSASYFDGNEVPAVLKDFKYFGKANEEQKYDFVHLGIHTCYEILNGSGQSIDWASKAKFLGMGKIAMCDKGTLAGTLPFQIACKKKGLKSIIGVTYDVFYFDEDVSYEVKLYVKNKEGWQNLLKLHKIYNIDKEGKINLKDLHKNTEGLFLVVSRKGIIQDRNLSSAKILVALRRHLKCFGKGNVFFQVDSVEFTSSKFDNDYLLSLKRYFDKFLKIIPPVLINDSYYIDREAYEVKNYLNSIGKSIDSHSSDQYFKSISETVSKIEPLFDFNEQFPGGFSCEDVFCSMFENTKKISNGCDFVIDTGNHKLPKFEWEGGEENEELFWNLLEEGLREKIGVDHPKYEEYLERIEIEANLIVGANFVDYFLILWDVCEYCKKVDIEYGMSRGSVGGCLLAFLLDIIKIDPLEWELLFERFMNEARVSGERAKSADALPDIDMDFETKRRDEVKRYFIEKYGWNQVAYVGSFTTLKLKGGLKDLGKVDGLSFNQRNYITSFIPEQLKYKWDDLFKFAQTKQPLYNFVQENPKLVTAVKHTMFQPKAESVHASALVVTPKYDEEGNRMEVWDWFPCRKIWDEKSGTYQLISEFEGESLERAGFLKEDILGLNLLDQFKNMKRLINKFYDFDLELLDIPLDDEKTLSLFSEGNCEGVFQFHSSGMKRYSKVVKPTHIEDLIAMNALFRPGPMRSDAHMDFARIKHGRKKPEFDYLFEDITKNTHGLYAFQEQIMKSFVRAGFSPVEADTVRTVIKKFKAEEMKTHQKRFISQLSEMYKENFGPKAKSEATKVWDKLMRFSGYGFNRSHSAAYSIMGYWSQWLKANFPLVFWTTVLEYSSSDFVTTCFLSEKEIRFPEIKVLPPDVNESGLKFIADPKKDAIYWSLVKIKGLGIKTAFKITKERKQNGKFSSLEDFHERVGGKGVMENLILSGSFDVLYDIDSKKNSYKRRELLKKVYELTKHKGWPRSEYDSKGALETNHYWALRQQQIAQLGWVDFKKLIYKHSPKMSKRWLSGKELESIKSSKTVVVAGMIQGFQKKISRKGNEYGRLNLRSNSFFIQIFVWSQAMEKYHDTIKSAMKTKTLIALSCQLTLEEKDDSRTYSMSEINKLITI